MRSQGFNFGHIYTQIDAFIKCIRTHNINECMYVQYTRSIFERISLNMYLLATEKMPKKPSENLNEMHRSMSKHFIASKLFTLYRYDFKF